MINKHISFLVLLLFNGVFVGTTMAQSLLDGYVFESNNRGYLNQCKITVFELSNNAMVGQLETGPDGHFIFNLPAGSYRVLANRDLFVERNDTIKIGKEKVFLKMELHRRPGYLLDATIIEAREIQGQRANAIQGSTIEIYNRTMRRPELTITDNTDAFFRFSFERGNRFTILIRKAGYLTKRIDAFIDISGCKVCIDGIRELYPSPADERTAGNQEVILQANIELDRAQLNQGIQLQNIDFDSDSSNIRTDAAETLDNLVTLMKDNPGISVELGMHTDSRGNDDYNLELSQHRADASKAYLIREGIDSARITAKGYGESQILNHCRNGVECSEEEHLINRRSVLFITGISDKTSWKSLQQILEAEEMERSKKHQAPRSKHLSEAKVSDQLPVLKPAAENLAERGDATPAPAPRPLQDVLHGGSADGPVRMLQLPPRYRGCAIELARSETELPVSFPAFREQKEVFRLLEKDGKFTYMIANIGSKDAATAYFRKKIKPFNKTAKLVLFTENGKQYLTK